MSIAALNWAWRQECPSAPSKLVLLALADKANEDGECWPGMGTVAAMAGVSTRQVSTHLAKLEEAGLVARKRRRMSLGRLGSYVFHLKMTSGSSLPVDHEKSTSGSEPPVEDADHRKSHVSTTGSSTSLTTGSSLPDKVHPSKSTPKGTVSNKKTAMPDGWTPTGKHIELAERLGVDVYDQAERFADHHASKGNKYANWDLAFNNWLKNAIDYGTTGRPRAPNAARGVDYAQRYEMAAAELERQGR